MMPALKVVTPGIHTTVQDLGRPGLQDAGVPVSGPLDRIGLRLANALVGNAPDIPALEMIMQGPAFEVAADAVRIALAGCNGAIDVGAPTPAASRRAPACGWYAATASASRGWGIRAAPTWRSRAASS